MTGATDDNGQPEPSLSGDLILLHAPSVFDFRDRDDMLFSYLSDSDSVNITSIYEMYPLGFFSMKKRLEDHGHSVPIVNVASLMLLHPTLDVTRLVSRMRAPVYGFDLHWMPQCHGAIELAELVKRLHPEALTVFGGISATYFAQELIEYPAVDLVLQGYDTLDPLTSLMDLVRDGKRDFQTIPNLLYKDGQGVQDNTFSHKPKSSYNDEAVDWRFFRDAPAQAGMSKNIMTLPNTGCAMDCPWCGGSRYTYRKTMGVKKTLITKQNDLILSELRSMGAAARDASIYALQCYSETDARMHEYLDTVKEMQFKSVSFEQFRLPSQSMLEKMADASRTYIMLSPESHDLEISRLAGRGNFTMDQMEEWLVRALDAGIAGVMVWFFIGMPKQTPQSVAETVDYAARLMDKFPGGRVVPLLCPMVPFLDPGSRFFENPQGHGYRIFHKSLADHRAAMVEPLWQDRLNYETEWMTRKQIQQVAYREVGRLVRYKADQGLIPSRTATQVNQLIDETTGVMDEMERALALDGALPPDLRRTIRDYNNRIFAYSSDQIIPTKRPFGNRWFDDFTVTAELVAYCTPHDASGPGAAPSGRAQTDQARP